jgi:hydroxypyruvate reductase
MTIKTKKPPPKKRDAQPLRPFAKPARIDRLRRHAAAIFNSALKAVQAETAVRRACRLKRHILSIGPFAFDLRGVENIVVIGGGKASAHMAAALEDMLGPKITHGLISVKHGHTRKLKTIELIQAGHPVPDAHGLRAARAIFRMAENAEKNDLVICLLSGGGSALLPLPAPPLTLADKQKTIRLLLACGASIDEINTLRKHLSAIKGGHLAGAAYPAVLVTLILSDVVGDRLDIIASGPTVPDPGTFQDCMDIIDRYQITHKLPPRVLNHIRAGIAGKSAETPKPGDRLFTGTRNLIIGSNAEALAAAAKKAASLGYRPLILSSMIEGNTQDAALFHTAVLKEIRKTGNPIPPPACILSGGETTVKVTGNGKGGRNQEFALAAAMEIQGEKNMVLLSAGTDGTDGPTDAAGAVIDPFTVVNARKAGLDPTTFFADNDSYSFFKKTGELLVTGPTGTNVMDLRILLVG